MKRGYVVHVVRFSHPPTNPKDRGALVPSSRVQHTRARQQASTPNYEGSTGSTHTATHADTPVFVNEELVGRWLCVCLRRGASREHAARPPSPRHAHTAAAPPLLTLFIVAQHSGTASERR